MWKPWQNSPQDKAPVPPAQETIGITSRKKAIETLQSILRDPHSKVADRLRLAHALITMLYERLNLEHADVMKEIKEAEELIKRLETESANEPTIQQEQQSQNRFS